MHTHTDRSPLLRGPFISAPSVTWHHWGLSHYKSWCRPLSQRLHRSRKHDFEPLAETDLNSSALFKQDISDSCWPMLAGSDFKNKVLSNQSCSGVWGKLLNLAAITERSGSTRAQCCITSRDFCCWSDSWWDRLVRGRSQTSAHSINTKGGQLNDNIDSAFSMRPLCFSDPEWGLFIRTNAMCPSWVN